MEPNDTPEQGIISMLEDAQDVGITYVVFGPKIEQLYFFDRAGDAMEFTAATNRQGQLPWSDISLPLQYMTIEQMLSELRKANPLTINEFEMNRNNLENLKEELKRLGFKDKVAADMEKQIEKGVPDFTLSDKVNGNKGQVDLSLHFRQSGQSDNYYFNKFTVALNTGKALEEGQKYMVISPNEQAPGKNLVKSFENVTEAIDFFKAQKGNSELAAGKDAAHKVELAKMENSKVNYVAKDFQRTFRTPAQTQTFFVERGRGFTAEQAANMIQGRSVYRDDLLN